MKRAELLEHILGQPRVAQAVTTIAIGVALFAPLIVRMSGWAGLAGVLLPLVLAAAGILWSQRLEIEVRHVPVTLMAFTAFAAASLTWARYPVEALGGILLLLGFGMLAVMIALVRDLSQIVRAFGTVLRVAIVASVVAELFTGLIIDMPLPVLGVHGNLTRLGPLQGVLGSADQLALVAVLAGVTSYVELRMHMLQRSTLLTTLIACVALVLLSRSAFGLGLALVAVFALAAIAFIRAAPAHARAPRQASVVLAAGILALAFWILRWPILAAIGGVSEALVRLGVWQQVMPLFPYNAVIGRGFLGRWNLDVPPYSLIRPVQSRTVETASSAYIDVLFQLGLVGLCLFALMLLAALGRSWLLASTKRSIVYQWPAVILTVLAIAGFASSAPLFELGWLLVVLCTVKASHQISWRSALAPLRPPADGHPG